MVRWKSSAREICLLIVLGDCWPLMTQAGDPQKARAALDARRFKLTKPTAEFAMLLSTSDNESCAMTSYPDAFFPTISCPITRVHPANSAKSKERIP